MIVIAVLAGITAYFMTADERWRCLRVAQSATMRARDVLTFNDSALAAFFAALRARTRWRFVMPLLIAVNALVFLLSSVHPNTPSATTHADWWRPFTSMFVHAGPLHFAIDLVALLQLGLVLEPAIGPAAFAAIYVSAGAAAAIVNVSLLPPSAAGVGASGGVFGLYGFLLAYATLLLRCQSGMTIPLAVFKKLIPATSIFVIYNGLTGHMATAAELAGVATGLAGGLVLAREVSERKPPLRRTSAWMAASVLLVSACAFVIHARAVRVIDIRPEIERVIELEHQSASTYDEAVMRFRTGRITASALANLVEQNIIPTLEAAARRLSALEHVPTEHQLIVARAGEFLKLRLESWQLRANALHESNMPALREADRREQASLQVFESVRPPAIQ